MKINRASAWVLFACVVVMAVLSAVGVVFPQVYSNLPLAAAQMPAPMWVMALVVFGGVLVVYGLLGFVGASLAKALGWPQIIDAAVSLRQRFFSPLVLGALYGLFMIVVDLVFSQLSGLSRLPHPKFPGSLLASLSAAIGEEIIFRLFFISLWTWVISRLILRGKAQTPVFWVVTFFSAIAFSASHLPSFMVIQQYQSIAQISPLLLAEIFVLNGGLTFLAAAQMKRSGYLAAAGVHFWADVIWHVVWGLFL